MNIKSMLDVKRVTGVLALVGLCCSVEGRTAGVSALPASTFADTEIGTNLVFAAAGDRLRTFDFELAFHGTPSNNVQVAFGADADADGALSLDEESAVFGWDCGTWFVQVARTDGGDDRFTAQPAVVTGAQVLRVSLRLRGDGGVEGLTVTDGAARAFTEASEALSAVFIGLRTRAWTHCRLTARGGDDPAAAFSIQTTQHGFRFLLR